MSTEFDALMAQTQLEREKADGIRSLIAASKLAADYQHRAEVAEASLDRVRALCSAAEISERHWVTSANLRAAIEGTS